MRIGDFDLNSENNDSYLSVTPVETTLRQIYIDCDRKLLEGKDYAIRT